MCVCNTQYITIVNTYICQCAIIHYQRVSLCFLGFLSKNYLIQTQFWVQNHSLKSKYPVLHFGGTEFWFLCHLGSRASAVLKKNLGQLLSNTLGTVIPKSSHCDLGILTTMRLYSVLRYYVMFHRISTLA